MEPTVPSVWRQLREDEVRKQLRYHCILLSLPLGTCFAVPITVALDRTYALLPTHPGLPRLADSSYAGCILLTLILSICYGIRLGRFFYEDSPTERHFFAVLSAAFIFVAEGGLSVIGGNIGCIVAGFIPMAAG